MNERLKALRKNLGLTQEEFAKHIGIKRNTLANYEIGRNDPIDAVLFSICREFNVNEEWLRNGTGEMFSESRNSVFEELTRQYNLDTTQQALVETILQMNDLQRQTLKTLAHNLVDKILSEENYEEFRTGYIKENAAPAAARDGDISGIAEAAALYDAAEDKGDK